LVFSYYGVPLWRGIALGVREKRLTWRIREGKGGEGRVNGNGTRFIGSRNRSVTGHAFFAQHQVNGSKSRLKLWWGDSKL
jgi:hypothetical protein